MATIVLDPGHGGTAKIGGSSANNAVGPIGLLEKTVTLKVALLAEKILAGLGHVVVLTRRSDVNLGLADRAKAARSIAAPVFVSVHLNGFNSQVQGTETICEIDHIPDSGALCRAVQKQMVAATGHPDRNKGAPAGVKTQSLGVLKRASHHARTACCLVEISFMDVAAEEARLKNAAYPGKISQALANGISDYLALAAGSQESVASSGLFEDGFAALAAATGSAALEAAPQQRTRPVAAAKKKVTAPIRKSDGTKDFREFAKVAIGEGLESAAIAARLQEPPGFDLQAFSNFVAGLGLRHFSQQEFLYLGSGNEPGAACAGRNSLPPSGLWSSIANTALMLDEIRHRLNAKCRILSAYRSPAYNTCIGGESGSFHMRFNAIDFRCAEGNPTNWHAVAKAVRASDPRFKGGIGLYSTFVHVDTRGSNANW